MACKNTHKGFSLVELSIVLVIIGLIIGGIMAGNALIDSARLNSVIADVEQFSKATDSFEATYGGLPGDIASTAALPTVTPAPTAGNGDGSIDSATESLQFWYQLMAAQLIPGNYDGTSTYVPATSGKTGGVPGGKMPNSGYTVTTTTAGLVITLGTFSSNSSTLATLTPAEALAIDQKLDDGKPTTGIVQAADGTGSASGSCVSGTAYASTTNDTPTCILNFTISRKAVISTSASTVTCSGIPAGTSRISTTSTCPTGYTGHVIESCIATNTNDTWTGAWVNIRQNCSQITCGNGYVAGDQQTVNCPAGYPNVSFTQTCQSNGLWKTNTATSPCGTPIISSSLAGQPCTYGASLFLSCPLGQSGTQTLACLSTGTWPAANTQYISSCSSITCSGTGIGVNSATTLACPSGYASGNVTQSCTLSGALKPTTNNCIPTYSQCDEGQTRAVTCPSGYTGGSTQTCSNSYWSTESNTCVPVTCGDQPIGAFRRALSTACPKGSIGTVYEVCDSDGAWKTVANNCSAMKCYATTDSATTSTWPASNAGTINIYSSPCSAGSTASARDCLYTGGWGSIKGSCVVTPCAAITTASSSTGYATWPQTAAGSNATGTCQSGYTGTPTRSCTTSGNTGTWGTISNPCTLACPAITTASSSTGYATWPQTNTGLTATGTCQSGYDGAPTPTRPCASNASWGTITGTCLAQCQTSSNSCSTSSASTRTASNCAKYYIASTGYACTWDGSNCVIGYSKKCSPTSTPKCYGSSKSSCSNIGATSTTCANYYLGSSKGNMQCTWGTGSGAYCYNGGSTCK